MFYVITSDNFYSFLIGLKFHLSLWYRHQIWLPKCEKHKWNIFKTIFETVVAEEDDLLSGSTKPNKIVSTGSITSLFPKSF